MNLPTKKQEHADLLWVCKIVASKGRFADDRFRPWHDYVPLLEQQMQQAVASLDEIGCIDDVVRLILTIETSEINPVFMGVVEATDSPFVRKLGPFRRAVAAHRLHLRETLRIIPSAAAACRELHDKFS